MNPLRVDEGLVLRTPREDHAEALFRLVDANRHRLREWLPWLDANRRVEDTLAFIRTSDEREKNGSGLVRLIFHDDALAGVVGFNWIDPTNRSGEIGYWIDEAREGRGIVTRCVRALVEHGFRALELNRISISVAAGNARSHAIPRRLGFAREGVRREAEWLYDHFVDHVVYALLRRELLGSDGA